MNKWIYIAVFSLICFSGCEPLIADKNGCLKAPGAELHWSKLKQKCVSYVYAEIQLTNVYQGKQYGGSAVLSDDKQQAEIHAIGVPPYTLLHAVENGYASPDGQFYLTKHDGKWILITK